ncbi:hypothetical protein K438DRAFT_1789822 [Mycena galopus ATCC 62051]|nr:hypothetical protein K438DRAFT_1789822 [Mycena galopus ATCC 62051]
MTHSSSSGPNSLGEHCDSTEGIRAQIMDRSVVPTPHSRSQKVQAENEAHAIKTKRDQWKAASARYYVRHPELKEKKRLQAAERRAAKKLARRERDCLKKEQIGEHNQLCEFPKNHDISLPKTSAQMAVVEVDLFTMPNSWNTKGGSDCDCVDDSHPGWDAHPQSLREQGWAHGENGQILSDMVPRDAWSILAPQYDSSDIPTYFRVQRGRMSAGGAISSFVMYMYEGLALCYSG